MIAAYQRISRADGDLGKDGKDKSNSIENQKELILRYISCKESLQNVPVMDFVDDGYTGSNFDRPGFQQMMDGVRNGKIDTIIVKDLSRFGRDYIGVGEYMEQIFPLLGVRLIAINDNYDSNNYKGTTLGMDVVVSNLVNTMYCRDAGKKLRTANQVKWRKGITTASAAPFGYQFDPDKKGAFIIDPPAAKIVRRIFDIAILGLGTRDIAMMLNDENIPVPSVYNKENKAYGKETTYTIAPVILWDSSRVWKILTAYVYTGAMVLGKTKTLISGKSIIRTVPKGQRYITEGTHEAIVSREEFEKAQLVIKSNSHKIDAGDDNPPAAPYGVAGKVVYGISASLFCMVFLSARQCVISNGGAFVPSAAVAGDGSISNDDRWIRDFYDTAGGRQYGGSSGTGGCNALAGVVHIRCPPRIACLWNCKNKKQHPHS